MNVKFLELKNYLNKNTPVCVAVSGDDAYLADKAVQQIKDSLNLNFLELNTAVFPAETEVGEIINACLAVPFLSPRRLVVAKDFAIPKAQNELLKLKDYCFSPQKTTCLVLCLKDGEKAKDLEVDTVVCDKLMPRVLVKWIVVKAKQCGRRISNANADKIVKYCAQSMTRINNETEKLCVYCNDEITEQAIDSLVEKDTDFEIWRLGEAISHKRADNAIDIAKQLSGKGGDITNLVASVYRLFRNMFYSLISAMSQEELAEQLNAKEYSIMKAREVAENFTQMQLKKALELCQNAETEIKSVNCDKFNVFWQLVLALLNL